MKDLFNTWLVNKYIAHRGLHNAKFPENSMSSFNNAKEMGYAIELDVRAIADGTPIVFHDETLKRMTGEDGYVINIENTEKLKSYHLNNTSETIPTFEEVLQTFGGKVPILIEIKDYNFNSSLEKKIYDLITKYKGDYAVMSFNPYSMRWFRRFAPEIIRGQLSSTLKGEKVSFFKRLMLRRASFVKRVADPQFIAYKWDEVPNKFVKKFNDLPLLVWAVNTQADYMKVAQYCDNIIFENFKPRI